MSSGYLAVTAWALNRFVSSGEYICFPSPINLLGHIYSERFHNY